MKGASAGVWLPGGVRRWPTGGGGRLLLHKGSSEEEEEEEEEEGGGKEEASPAPALEDQQSPLNFC